ncbi:MAG: ORF6N domain-containing protein [Sulfuricurvum sp.]|jgi:phage regulator Rha-like protein
MHQNSIQPLQITNEIQSKIYTLRDTQVMLDKDLATLYGVKPIRLREQVKRNIERFPDDFMFELNEQEIDFMVSQNAIPSKQHLGGAKPYVFTEQGVSMLSSVLRTDMAVQMSIQIVRAFVKMKKFILNNANLFEKIEQIEKRQFSYEIKKDLGKKWFGFSKFESDSFGIIGKIERIVDGTRLFVGREL